MENVLLENKVKLFYEWYIDWYKNILNSMTIMISLPNEFRPIKEDNAVIIECFKPNNDFVLSLPHLQFLLEKADEFGITVYIDPQPKYNTRNSKNLYVQYYKEYGFELMPNEELMKRLPQTIDI
jgi:hypothetical protein